MHFITDDGTVLHMNDALRAEEYAGVILVCELCVRDVIANHETLLMPIRPENLECPPTAARTRARTSARARLLSMREDKQQHRVAVVHIDRQTKARRSWIRSAANYRHMAIVTTIRVTITVGTVNQIFRPRESGG